MSNVVTTPVLFHTLMKALIAGLPKLPSTLTGVAVLNQTYAPTELAAKVATFEVVYAAADAADLAKETADKARDEIEPTAHEFVMAAVAALKAGLGRTSATLETLGVAPDKVPAQLTVEQKAEKVAKGNATRKARGTMGKRQKARITGQTPAPTTGAPTPVTPPATTKTGA